MLYHHGHILFLAKKAYERSVDDHSESFVSIALSAMALECYVNDFTHQSSSSIFSQNEKSISDLTYILSALENAKSSLIAKIEAIIFLLTGAEMDKGGAIHQELAMLMKLRNELVHRKPESLGSWNFDNVEKEYEPHRYVKFFYDRGIIEKPLGGNPPTWSQYLNNSDVARWAYNLVVRTIEHIVFILPSGNLSKVQSMMIKDMVKI